MQTGRRSRHIVTYSELPRADIHAGVCYNAHRAYEHRRGTVKFVVGAVAAKRGLEELGLRSRSNWPSRGPAKSCGSSSGQTEASCFRVQRMWLPVLYTLQYAVQKRKANAPR